VFSHVVQQPDGGWRTRATKCPAILFDHGVQVRDPRDPMLLAIIMDMLKDNPNERISSADVVSRTNNLIKFQLRIGLLFEHGQ
jgi:hypothetical protein